LKPGWRAADRCAELLAAARGWLAAGLIDETTFGSIAAEGPTTGPRLGRTWRILVFACVVIGVSTSTAVAFLSFGLHEATEVGCTLLLAGLALAAVTEVVIDRCHQENPPLRTARSGHAVACWVDIKTGALR